MSFGYEGAGSVVLIVPGIGLFNWNRPEQKVYFLPLGKKTPIWFASLPKRFNDKAGAIARCGVYLETPTFQAYAREKLRR